MESIYNDDQGCTKTWLSTRNRASILILGSTRTRTNNKSDYYFKVKRCKQK